MRHVLIVDDDEDDRDLLNEASYEINPAVECLSASNAYKALQDLKSPRFPKPELIFLDYNMPRMNGIECLKKLKEDISLRNIPVAMLTTSTSEKDKMLALAAGAAHFVVKPSTFKGLCNIVKEVFDTHKLASK